PPMAPSGAWSGLTDRLDFTIGEVFEQEVRRRFGTQVNHESPSPRGSFFLLATFRRSLVRISEESVGFILESCLGGHAPFFHVVEVSHNHFRFSVSCKAVGLFVYNLRRVIGSVFDVYFHLWSSGAPYWEREKRLWEAEEELRWTKVLSKSQKRADKKKAIKRVSFAKQIVCHSPLNKSAPPMKPSFIRFGAFDVDISSANGVHDDDVSVQALEHLIDQRFALSTPNQVLTQNVSVSATPSSGILKKSSNNDSETEVATEDQAHCNMSPNYFHSASHPETGTGRTRAELKSVFSSGDRSLMAVQVVKHARCLGGCTRCFRLDHSCFECREDIRCAFCFNYGHRFKFCLTKSRPRVYWRPKRPLHGEQPTQCETVENKEAPLNSFASRNPSPGPPITLELPLPVSSDGIVTDRQLQCSSRPTLSFECDYQIREMANQFHLHKGFGPPLSVEMLLKELALLAGETQKLLPLKDALPSTSWNFFPPLFPMKQWFLDVDNPSRGGNAEASTSTGFTIPRLVPINNNSVEEWIPPSNMENTPIEMLNRDIVVYDQQFAIKQIMENLHPLSSIPGHSPEPLNMESSTVSEVGMEIAMEIDDEYTEEHETGTDLMEIPSLEISTPVTSLKKRKGRPKTPIVDDEVRRSSRFGKNVNQTHVQLDREPRRKPGAARKTVYLSTVEDLKSAIISQSLEYDPDVEYVEPIQADTLFLLGTSFCGIPPEELTDAGLHYAPED
uniref:Uncharacterized protein n=1 Tax=Setaria italica TaxID=4555 RepID=K4A297_SETIT